LFFKYILLNNKQIFLKYLHRNDKNLIIYTSINNIYYLSLHIKLSSFFYSTQLIDIFSYETPASENMLSAETQVNQNTTSILVYNFHSIFFQQRFFLVGIVSPARNQRKQARNSPTPSSITEVFLNANWLERENSELHGILFTGKKDIRNLMLTYGDTSAPMKKSSPSIGIKEIFYDVSTDSLIQTPVSIQF